MSISEAGRLRELLVEEGKTVGAGDGAGGGYVGKAEPATAADGVGEEGLEVEADGEAVFGGLEADAGCCWSKVLVVSVIST